MQGTESNVNAIDLAAMIARLSDRDAFPYSVDHVDVRQTHISVLFLAGQFAYKLKKPVKLPFLDFSTMARRRYFCDEEVRINRRLVPDVYLGVVPVCHDGQRLRFESGGSIIDWAVKMTRLPDDATIAARLERDTISVTQVAHLAKRLAEFHSIAPKAGTRSKFGSFNSVAQSLRDNLIAAEQQLGRTLSPAVLARLNRATSAALDEAATTIASRAASGFIRELHGDLHLDHIYLFPDKAPPGDLVIVDAIEFNELFRWIDVVADMAFCVMDFLFRCRRDLAEQFVADYFIHTRDESGRRLLPLYTSYRAAVRAKVEGLTACETEIGLEQQTVVAQNARAHWLIALGELESATQRPSLVLMSGLPGTGKSTVARSLSEAARFQVIRSDVVRKELAAAETDLTHGSTATGFQEGLYSPDWTDRTYAECLRRAESALLDGARIMIDATFLQDAFRQRFARLGLTLGIPVVWICCQTSPDVARQRLEARQWDASDADWTVYQHAAESWQPPTDATRRLLRTLNTSGNRDDVAARALNLLCCERLA